MGKKESRKKLTELGQKIHGAVWLIGLAILALKGWWWPGILVLVAISMIVEAVLMLFAPTAYIEAVPSNDIPDVTLPDAIKPAGAMDTLPHHRLDLLPRTCPGCGGPIRGGEVKWTGTRSADCPFCGVNLPMKQEG